jgi:hypothetical protein
METLMMLLVLAALAICARAHIQAKWFRKQKIQKKLMLQHIAAWQSYRSFVIESGALAPKRLATMDGGKTVVPGLNKEYFGSLKTVSLRVKDRTKVAEIIAFQAKVMKAQKHFYRQVQVSGVLHTNEINYIERIFKRLQDDCKARIDEIILATSHESPAMKNSERHTRIDSICQEMQDKFTITKSICRGAIVLGNDRISQNQKTLQTLP